MYIPANLPAFAKCDIFEASLKKLHTLTQAFRFSYFVHQFYYNVWILERNLKNMR